MAIVHPDLVRRHRWSPRGLGRRWLLPFLRAGFRLGRALSGVRLEPLQDGVRGLVVRPRGRPPTGAGLLWLHGGGLIMGDPSQDAVFLQEIADQLGFTVVAPAYRLAPEHPFPAGLDDAESALRWLASHPGIDGPLAVGGASAGGGLVPEHRGDDRCIVVPVGSTAPRQEVGVLDRTRPS